MTLRYLQKWHGAGNDFLVDVQEHGQAPWWNAERVRAVCRRTSGVGADGLLIATVGSEVAMVLYNADGSRAEMSGNGIRCLAAAVRRSTRGAWSELEVETDAGTKRVTLMMDRDGGEGSVAMGEVELAETPDGAMGAARVGNPHVVLLDDPSWTRARREELADAYSTGAGGANVEFVTVLGPDRLGVTVVERGVGWTESCGTGSCAVAAVARREGLAGDEVDVVNPGGTLHVSFDGNTATLRGPVQFVANVEWLET